MEAKMRGEIYRDYKDTLQIDKDVTPGQFCRKQNRERDDRFGTLLDAMPKLRELHHSAQEIFPKAL